MNKNIIYKLITVAVLPLLLFSCDSIFEDNEIRYDGPPQVEFKPTSQTLTLAADQSGTISVDVQLIGEQRNEDITVGVSVVEDETDAISGDHYTLPNNSVTIVANSSVASFDINVTGENLDVGEQRTLVLQLVGNENVKAAENLKTFTLTLQGGG